MTVGERLRAARLKLKKTQAQVAIELDLKQPTVCSWEADESLPRTENIRAVAKAYGLRPEQLLPNGSA